MNRIGYGHRMLVGEQGGGSVTRILIGSVPTATIVTFEQQPGHEPVAFLQDATLPDKVRKEIRPTGEARPLTVETAKTLVEFAFNNGLLPGGDMALDFAQSY